MNLLGERGAEAIAEAWNDQAPAKYRLDADLVRLNLLDHPLLHAEASGWIDGGFVAVKRSASDLYAGPDPKVAHLSLFTPLSPTTLERLKATLCVEGVTSLVVGQDSGHFLPGAPTDVPWMGLSLRTLGFEAGGLAFDLERDLGDLKPEVLPSGFYARVLSPDDRRSLDEFFAREFPGRWRYDVMGKFNVEGAETVFGLFGNDRCEGFALLQSEGCRRPIGGAVWRNDLGPQWSSLGPIGISQTIRGGGLGRAFLNRALVELQERGARRTIIDWTGLVDFYGTQGFSVTRAYRSYRLRLTEDPPPAT